MEPNARVLFVCLGNICRSPLAEAIFAAQVRAAGVDHLFQADSAGTGRWHVGDTADPRTLDVAERRGVHVASIARQVRRQDYERFDLILAMDQSNLAELHSQCPPSHQHKLKLMREYDVPRHRGADVPDPYWGGADGFERLFDLLDMCCRNLLDSLTSDLEASAPDPPEPDRE